MKIKCRKLKADESRFNIDVTEFPLYWEGFEVGYQKGIEKVSKIPLIERVLLKTDWSTERIAILFEVSTDCVLDIRKRLENTNKI